MMFQTDVNWLEEKFTDCSVALAVTIVNASNEFVLRHVETYFHDGCGDPFYNVPTSIDPKGGRATFVSRNSDRSSRFFEGLTGTSGVTVWAVTQCHSTEEMSHVTENLSGRRHLVVMWSAPRNFYAFENTLSVGLTVGPPSSNLKDLFNLMYYGEMKQTFHTRFSCAYATTFNSGNYGDNRFVVTGQIGGRHKDMAVITFFDSKANDVTESDIVSSALMAPLTDLPPQLPPTTGRATVKCLVHYHEQPAFGSRVEIRDVLYDYHLALAFDFEETNELIWVCELARRTSRKDSEGNTILEWNNENSVSCHRQTKARILEDRKRLGLIVFRLGQVGIDLADVHYACDHLPIASDSNPELPFCHFWIQSLASKLNLPNQHILELLSKGDNGWFGLDWLNSIKEVFETQTNELRLNESSAESEWINRIDEDPKDGILPQVRIGGFEKLRMYKCSL